MGQPGLSNRKLLDREDEVTSFQVGKCSPHDKAYVPLHLNLQQHQHHHYHREPSDLAMFKQICAFLRTLDTCYLSMLRKEWMKLVWQSAVTEARGAELTWLQTEQVVQSLGVLEL